MGAMITAKTDLKMAAGTEGCYRVTITDVTCPNPTIASAAINGETTTSPVSGATDDIGAPYIGDPFGLNVQGTPTKIPANPLDPTQPANSYTWVYL